MIKLSVLAVLLFSGCSNMTFNATMCDQIASDPHATMPQECRNYVEEEAQKAFDKTNEKQNLEITDDMVRFKKEQIKD